MQIEPVRRHSLISFFSIIGLTAIGYLSTMYFAHVLGPAILGSYFIFLAYYGIFELVCDSGLGGAAVKRISEGIEQDQYFSAYIALRVIMLVISLMVLFIISSSIQDISSSGLVTWLFLALVIGTLSNTTLYGVYGTGMVGVAQISAFLNTVIKFIAQIVATFLGFAAGGLAGGFVVGMVAGLLINFRFLTLHLSRFNKEHLNNLFSFSFWVFLSSSGIMVFVFTDTILIGYFLSNADVGVYRVAFQMTGAATFTSMSLRYVLYPKVSNWHATGQIAKAESALSRAFTYSLLLAIPVVAGGLLLGDRLLYYLYGPAFESGTAALFFLLLIQVANIFMYLHTMCLNAIDQPKKSFTVTAIAVILNIILNIALIPPFGITGAAIATFGSITLNAILSYQYLSQSMQVKLERMPVLHIIISTLAMAVSLILFRFFFGLGSVLLLAVSIAIGGALYFLLLFRIDRGIRNDIRSIMATIGIPWPVIF